MGGHIFRLEDRKRWVDSPEIENRSTPLPKVPELPKHFHCERPVPAMLNMSGGGGQGN